MCIVCATVLTYGVMFSTTYVPSRWQRYLLQNMKAHMRRSTRTWSATDIILKRCVVVVLSVLVAWSEVTYIHMSYLHIVYVHANNVHASQENLHVQLLNSHILTNVAHILTMAESTIHLSQIDRYRITNRIDWKCFIWIGKNRTEMNRHPRWQCNCELLILTMPM